MSNQQTNVTLDREAFKAWLESMPGEYPVGQARKSMCCPIAEFLMAKGVREPIVGAIRWLTLDDEGDGKETPEWASAFILGVDEGRKSGDEIDASMALKILTEVPCLPVQDDLV